MYKRESLFLCLSSCFCFFYITLIFIDDLFLLYACKEVTIDSYLSIYRNHQRIDNSAVVTELFYKPFVIYFDPTMY